MLKGIEKSVYQNGRSLNSELLNSKVVPGRRTTGTISVPSGRRLGPVRVRSCRARGVAIRVLRPRHYPAASRPRALKVVAAGVGSVSATSTSGANKQWSRAARACAARISRTRSGYIPRTVGNGVFGNGLKNHVLTGLRRRRRRERSAVRSGRRARVVAGGSTTEW